MLSTSAGRRKCFPFAVVMPVCTGDLGARARHLPRKRICTSTSNTQTFLNYGQKGQAQRPAPTQRFPESTQFMKNQRRNAPRGGMLSTSAGRRKCFPFAVVMPVCTGNFGTRARHLPRKRIDPGRQHQPSAKPSTIQTSKRAGGHGGPPLRRDFSIEDQR